jgi:hypothetical protein
MPLLDRILLFSRMSGIFGRAFPPRPKFSRGLSGYRDAHVGIFDIMCQESCRRKPVIRMLPANSTCTSDGMLSA